MGKQGVKIEIMDTTLRDGEQTTIPCQRRQSDHPYCRQPKLR